MQCYMLFGASRQIQRVFSLPLSWTLANFRCSGSGDIAAISNAGGIFTRSRVCQGPCEISYLPHIPGHSAHPPLQKLAKVQLSSKGARPPSRKHCWPLSTRSSVASIGPGEDHDSPLAPAQINICCIAPCFLAASPEWVTSGLPLNEPHVCFRRMRTCRRAVST
jgi:hypothetical protein